MTAQRSPLSGSANDVFSSRLCSEVANAIGVFGDVDDRADVTLAALAAFEPQDEVEGMLAAQALALHYAAMDCLRRATRADLPADVVMQYRKLGANLARAMVDMLDTLDRKRGKAQQVAQDAPAP